MAGPCLPEPQWLARAEAVTEGGSHFCAVSWWLRSLPQMTTFWELQHAQLSKKDGRLRGAVVEVKAMEAKCLMSF